MNAFRRISQRYLAPRWLVSIYFYFKYKCVVSTRAQVQFTDCISFGSGCVVKAFAVIQTQTGHVKFGADCAVSSFDHISTGTADVVIGDHVRIASGVTLLGGDRNFGQKEVLIVEQGASHQGLRIGDDVLIGANAVILPGSHIGKGAVIGAGSVVTEEVPDYAIVAGSPARIIGHRK